MWLCCCELGVRGREAAHPQPCAVTRTRPGTVQAPNSREPESPSLLVKRAKCKVSPGTAPGCGLQAALYVKIHRGAKLPLIESDGQHSQRSHFH